MNVKGTVFLTGKVTITEAFGEERWKVFMAKLAAKDNFFNNMIMSITIIPIDKFILFLDELCNEYFNGDKSQYLMFGMVAAKFALSPGGPYQSHLLTKDIKQFVESVIPKLWTTYYDGGVLTAKFENNVVHIKISGIEVKYYYFEQCLMGFFQQAIKVFGKKTVATTVRSLSSGDDDVYYQFELKDP